MDDTPYTLAMWRVIAGRQADFVAAWKELATVFAALPNPPIEGTLLQSTADPHLYYSFGPWKAVGDVMEMRNDPGAQAALERLRSLCEEASPGSYRRVLHVNV